MVRLVNTLLQPLSILFVVIGLLFSAFGFIGAYFIPKYNYTSNFIIPAQNGKLGAMQQMEFFNRRGHRAGFFVIPKDEKQADYWKRRIEEAERNHKS